MSNKREKPTYNMLQNTYFMLKHAAKHEPSMLFLIAGTVIGTIMASLAQLYLPRTVVADIEKGESIQNLITSVIVLIMIAALGNMMISVSDIYRSGKGTSLRNQLVMQAAHKNLVTSYENFDDPQYKAAKMRSKEGLGHGYTGSEEIYRTFPKLLISVSGFFIYVALLMSVNPVILVITALSSVTVYYVSRRYNLWMSGTRKERQDYYEKFRSIHQNSQDLKLAKDIRLFGMEDWICNVHNHYLELWKSIKKKQGLKGCYVDLVAFLMSVCREGIAYAYLVYLAVRGEIIASEFILMFAAISGFAGYVTGIFTNLERLHKNCIDIDGVRVFQDYPEKFPLDRGEILEADLDNKYEFELKNIRYKYFESEENTIKGLNLKINSGENLAVVGLNGAGKTTFIKLLCGLYDPTEGEVLLNGQNIKCFNRRSYYKLFSAVFQDFSILPLTIKQNIAQNMELIDEEKVQLCVKLAGLENKFDELEKGLDSLLDRTINEDAVDLSGGELQRLMLARALYKNAPVLLLDEPTAALDPIAENDIYQKYNELTKGRTSVFISHRLASTRFCDRIIYMENGTIAEEGTHEELMALRGKYYELFEIQSKYYKKGAVENEC